ncbi:hypothetical protein OG618_03535 [Kitasatospora sp. NBC_01246]|uniref:hypothetical protein n=1 Tax=Kitasatospora sp. NBC_01246 TaxID=2903570 RepID=UPI002E325F5C|nr:hypothetical protein [Kitasatospora sp. NBC_01246]
MVPDGDRGVAERTRGCGPPGGSAAVPSGAVGAFGTLKEKDVIKVNAKIARAG